MSPTPIFCVCPRVGRWGVCFELEFWPLFLTVGGSFLPADTEAAMPTHELILQLPFLKFSIRICKLKDLLKLKAQMEE